MPTLAHPRWEALARRRVVALDESQAASYRIVGYRARGHSAYVNASRLLRNADVARRIEELRQAAAARHQRTIDHIADELDAAYALAHREGQAHAAVSATMAKAKLFGLIINKNESMRHDNNNSDPIEMLVAELGSEEAALAAIEAMRAKLIERIGRRQGE